MSGSTSDYSTDLTTWEVTLRGNMTAANQLAIDRDYEHADGSVSHTRLNLQFDSRQKVGGQVSRHMSVTGG